MSANIAGYSLAAVGGVAVLYLARTWFVSRQPAATTAATQVRCSRLFRLLAWHVLGWCCVRGLPAPVSGWQDRVAGGEGWAGGLGWGCVRGLPAPVGG